MKVLISTGHFGMGHFAAAKSVEKDIQCAMPCATVMVTDIMDAVMPKVKDAVYRGFNSLVNRWTDLYNLIGKVSGKTCAAPFKHIFIKKIDDFLVKEKPDVLISTLPMSTQYLAAYKKHKNSEIPLYTFITDISAEEEWVTPYCDGYFVATNEIKTQLIHKGIKTEKIFVTGIPVDSDFKTGEKQLSSKKHLLIMGGGLGLIPLNDCCFKMLDEDSNIRTTVITGNNESLYKELKAKYPNLEVLGYVDNVYDYMVNADVFLTKSGGISMFEAIHAGVPMYIISPFLVQEIANANFIEENGLGVVEWNQREDALNLMTFLYDTEGQSNIKKQMRTMCQNFDEGALIRLLEQNLEEKVGA